MSKSETQYSEERTAKARQSQYVKHTRDQSLSLN